MFLRSMSMRSKGGQPVSRPTAAGGWRERALSKAAAMAVGAILAGSASAAPVYWTDWVTPMPNPTTVNGAIMVGSTMIGVQFSGPLAFLSAGPSCSSSLWWPVGTYTSTVVDNGPYSSHPCDYIALSAGGAKTITFSQPVVDPILAMASWNYNTVHFYNGVDTSTPTQVVIEKAGPGTYSGGGTYWPTLISGGTGFQTTQSLYWEFHGIVRLPGTFSAITFTDTTENWHGFTVGIMGLAATGGGGSGGGGSGGGGSGGGGSGGGYQVPEPAPIALLALGLVALAARRLRAVASAR